MTPRQPMVRCQGKHPSAARCQAYGPNSPLLHWLRLHYKPSPSGSRPLGEAAPRRGAGGCTQGGSVASLQAIFAPNGCQGTAAPLRSLRERSAKPRPYGANARGFAIDRAQELPKRQFGPTFLVRCLPWQLEILFAAALGGATHETVDPQPCTAGQSLLEAERSEAWCWARSGFYYAYQRCQGGSRESPSGFGLATALAVGRDGSASGCAQMAQMGSVATLPY